MYSQQWQPYTPENERQGYTQPGYAQAEYPQPEYPQPEFGPPDLEQTAYLHPGHGQQNAAAAITVTMRYMPLAFLLGLFTPVLVIDGQPIRAGWQNPIMVPVAPGQHEVHAHTPYLFPRRIGKADLVVTARPGQTVELEYKAPLVVFARGALGSPQQGYPGMAAMIAILVVTALLTVCGLGSTLLSPDGFAALRSATERTTPSAPAKPDIPPLPPLSTDGPGLPDLEAPQPGKPAPTEASGVPELRTGVPVRKVAGGTFTAGDRTTTAAFAGWPFAFRTPRTWTCARETDAPAPDARLYICRDARNTGNVNLVAVMLRPCAAPCSAATRNLLHQSWFRPQEKPRRAGTDTRVVEIPTGDTGRYELYLSHLFASGGGTPDWQVAVAATAPPKNRAAGQKVLNDILSQTS